MRHELLEWFTWLMLTFGVIVIGAVFYSAFFGDGD
jgi:hypothetical protein